MTHHRPLTDFELATLIAGDNPGRIEWLLRFPRRQLEDLAQETTPQGGTMGKEPKTPAEEAFDKRYPPPKPLDDDKPAPQDDNGGSSD